ncbi:MAG: helix-turn-helix domain-containing protein [Acidimicrobiales bacterium]
MSDLAPADQAEVERLAYSPAEIAHALGCTRQHIQNLIGRGELPSVKLGRKRLIPRHVVDELLGADRPRGAA